MRVQYVFGTIGVFMGACVCFAPAQAAHWLQFGYDQTHTGNNTAEQGYSTPTGNRLLYSYSLPSAADSAPVYLGGVATAAGTKNLLFVVTMNGTLLALDADAASASVIWSKKPAGNGTLTTGSPAIDPGLQYVYAYGLDGNVHKYQAGTGAETMTGGWPQVSTLKPDAEKGAAGLSIASPPGGTSYLYSVTDGYIGDGNDYQGHITTINLSSGAQSVFNTLCSNMAIHFVLNGTAGVNDCASKRNGIWGRPGAIYDPGTQRVFITTGNGPYDPANVQGNGKDWGDSVLALNADGTGSGGGLPVDSYTPSTYARLEGTDADLGANALAVVPAPAGSTYSHLGVIAGKDGCVRLIRLDNMSGQGAPANVGGSLQSQPIDSNVSAANCVDTNSSGGNDANSDEIRAQPAVWVNPRDSSSWVFVANGNTLVGYKVAVSAGTPALVQQWTSSGGTSPIVANGTLYYVSSSGVRALNPATGGQIWADSSNGYIHWQSPIVANGHLFVVDSGSKLWVYALDGIFKNGFE